jgi:hypothetical protein
VLPDYAIKGVAVIDDQPGLGGNPGKIVDRVVCHQQHQVGVLQSFLIKRRRCQVEDVSLRQLSALNLFPETIPMSSVPQSLG